MPETLTEIPFANVATGNLEDAVSQASEGMTASERRIANDALLARLHQAKENYRGPTDHYKRMLRVPEISALVNALVVLNTPWIRRVITSQRQAAQIHESAEELTSIAIAGRTSLESDAGGAIGGILRYDYGRFGDQSFTPYLARAIRSALVPSTTEQKEESFRNSCTHEDHAPEHVRWQDRCARKPESPLIEAELLAVIQQALQEMPPHRRGVARFMIDRVLETGELPTFKEIGEARTPPVSKQRAQQLAGEAINALVACMEERYPHLAQEGLNGWEAFRDTLKGKRQVAGRA